MKQPRTAELLSDLTAEDLIWRKKEIAAFKWVVSKASQDRRPGLVRSAIPLLYAHWEGYVKQASTRYLEFLSYQRLSYRQLAPHFLALAARGRVRKAGNARVIGPHLEVSDFFVNHLDDESVIPVKDGINTEANLSSTVLAEIVHTLGLDYSFFETKEQLIDKMLLSRRNKIAHGEYLSVTERDVEEISAEVLAMLEVFRTEVDNAAALRSFEAA